MDDHPKDHGRLLKELQEDNPDTAGTRINFAAKSVLSGPIKLREFRTTLETRLNKLPYPYPDPLVFILHLKPPETSHH